MPSLLSNGMEPWLAALVVISIVVFVIGFLLWRGKRMAEKERTTRLLREAPPVKPLPVVPPPPPHSALTPAERRLHDMTDRYARLADKGNLAELCRLSSETIELARRTVSRDHWTYALALNVRACYLFRCAAYEEAKRLLEPACVIISEWPGAGEKDRNIELLNNNLKLCRERLGF